MRYYEDLYGNQYRWATIPEGGKYTSAIYKFKTDRFYGRFILTKKRIFSKRRMAKAWCLKHVRRAKTRQQVVLDAREKRKEDRLELLPKFTKAELKLQKIEKEVERLNNNIKRADKKMKSLTTRKKTYEKKIKVSTRQIKKLAELL